MAKTKKAPAKTANKKAAEKLPTTDRTPYGERFEKITGRKLKEGESFVNGLKEDFPDDFPESYTSLEDLFSRFE